jgi:hypothetical protein
VRLKKSLQDIVLPSFVVRHGLQESTTNMGMDSVSLNQLDEAQVLKIRARFVGEHVRLCKRQKGRRFDPSEPAPD